MLILGLDQFLYFSHFGLLRAINQRDVTHPIVVGNGAENFATDCKLWVTCLEMFDGLLVELGAACELLHYIGFGIVNNNIHFKITLLGELARLI